MTGPTRKQYAQALDRLAQVEAALEAQQAFSDHLLSTVQTSVVVLDEQGNIVYINPFLERLSGYPLAEVMARNWFATFLPARERGCRRSFFPQAADGVQARADVHPMVTRSGEERLIRWRDHPLPPWAANAHWLLASGVDVTAQMPEGAPTRHGEGDGLRQDMEEAIATISKVAEARVPYAAGHQRRVAELGTAIGGRMGLSEHALLGLRVGCMLHNIGKLQVPAEILAKPGSLDVAEYALVKEHARFGHEILREIHFPWPVAEIVYQHHERLDGSGYPRGLQGEQICLEARIVAVADVVGAMSARRAYRGGMGVEAGLAEIRAHKGVRYDAEAVDACLGAFADGFRFAEDGMTPPEPASTP